MPALADCLTPPQALRGVTGAALTAAGVAAGYGLAYGDLRLEHLVAMAPVLPAGVLVLVGSSALIRVFAAMRYM